MTGTARPDAVPADGALSIPSGPGDPSSAAQARASHLAALGRQLARNPLALMGLGVVVLLVLAATPAPLATLGASPNAQDLGARLRPPDGAHWFGTDELGRDIYARTVYGARSTLAIVALVGAVVVPIGLLVGTLAGYAGGIVDAVLMRLTDIFLAFPSLVLALAFAAALGPGIVNAVIAIALTAWPPYARLARAETAAIVRTDFIAAVVLQGASVPRILLHHVVPLCLSSVVIRLTLDMAGIVLTAAGLGFLGLGAQPPTPEWGAMVAAGRSVVLDQWWVATIPGLAIFTVSLAFNVLGDGLRDLLDPRSA